MNYFTTFKLWTVYFSTVLQALMRRQDAVIVKLEALQKRVESLMSRSSAASAMTTSSKTNNKKRDVKLPKVNFFSHRLM